MSELLDLAAQAHFAGALGLLDELLDAIAQRPQAAAAGEIAAALSEHVGRLWDAGWQPADLHRAGSKRLGADGIAVLCLAIADEARRYATLGDEVAPGWMAQLHRIGAAPSPVHAAGPSFGIAGWRAAVAAAAEVASLLLTLPQLPRLADPPSAWRQGVHVDDTSLPPSVLDKVRALLAKAESTNFEAEAEAFTAKAQELMARYRIDRALLDARSGATARPVGRRIGVEDPYADAKVILLAGIARANGGNSVWSKEFGFATVFAHPSELDATEELFTSLLVQVSGALRRAGSKSDASGRSRTRAFRQSFILAFASRISQRLAEEVATTVDAATAETGVALVPLLAAREEAARAAADEAFGGKLRSFRPSASDREGWVAGTAFADQADLTGTGPAVGRAG